MVEDHANDEQMPLLADKSEEEGEHVTPGWLHVLLRTCFWRPCSRGHKDENRAEDCLFCLQCYEIFCPHCTHNEPGHRLLKVRRYVYRSVVLAKDMQELNIDVSRIQTHIVNKENVVHLRPMRRSKHFRPQSGAPPCQTCGCWLRDPPNLFCSLTCKERADVSLDDFSGPDAERRYRNLQPNMLPLPEANEQHRPEADNRDELQNPEQVEAPPVVNLPGPSNISYRKRSRKQMEPQRAPFF